ncbi:hypothetical protein [Crocosphaera sp. Alani8]|uniref:hypothetical protein n=1 Tax=Crocosphaera sp. Alani8 TaxID=3038952 RepID=UPI00313F1D4D
MKARKEIAAKPKKKRQTITLDPWEDSVHYQTMVSFRYRGMNVGAYLLKKNPKSPFSLVFGFSTPGIHSFLSDGKLEKTFDSLEVGLKDLPQGERITFHLGAYQSDANRQAHLEKLLESAPSDELKFLLAGERGRIRQLAREGLREPKSLNIFCTYQTRKGEKHQDWLDIALQKLNENWQKFQNKSKRVQTNQIKRILKRAWGDGFIHWKQILENKLGLRVTPMSPQKLWEYLWGRINETKCPIGVPQQLIVSPDQPLVEEINSQMHATTLLLETEPKYAREYVKLGEKYLGILTFWEKPGGWSNKRSQLHYLWDIVAKDLVTDTEIITQIEPGNSKRVAWKMSQVTKQSMSKARYLAERNEADVASKLSASSGEQAQEKILMGETAYYVATTILVKRRNLEDLEEACRYIENCFHRPALVLRERHITWDMWRQTLPIVDEKLLGGLLTGRRMMYLSGEVPGFLPVITTHSKDTEGLELIGEDGGTPLYIDLFNTGNDKHRHLGVFGTTRSGKSVLVGGILTQALPRNIPVVAIDYPKPDGSSTYTTYTEFMGERGAYFNVGEQSVNLFDRPNLKRLSVKKQEERFEDYKDFLVSCLQVMVVGESRDILLNQTVKTLLYQTMNRFFRDATIKERYELAESAGLGSSEWEDMPTLCDFLLYFRNLVEGGDFDQLRRKKTVAIGTANSLLDRALEQISLRLQYWTESRVGGAISKPSSVPTNASLMVLALRQVSDNEDAAILSLVAYAAALRRAMEFPLSIFFIDESPILFKFPSIVDLVASIISNGSKSGVRVVLSAQDPNTIFNSASGQQIFQNLNTRIIGRIQPSAIKSFIEILGYPEELIALCANFYPKAYGMYTNWLVDDSGTKSVCRYYPAPVQLALVANNPDEQLVRQKFLDAYPDKFEAISLFSNALVESIQSSKKLDIVATKYLPTAFEQELAA